MEQHQPPEKVQARDIIIVQHRVDLALAKVQQQTKQMVDAITPASTPPVVVPIVNFQNGWVPSSGVTGVGATAELPGYCQIGPIVYLRGSLSNGSSGQIAFVLPAALCPRRVRYLACNAANAAGYVQIDQAGNVYLTGSTVQFSLDGLSFDLL